MPKLNRKLTELEIRTAKIKKSDYKLYDEGGLRLLVRKSGTKVWQLPYKMNGKWNVHTIGRIEEITSTEARVLRDIVKAQIRQGIDPNQDKRSTRIKKEYESRNSFESLAMEWYGKQTWATKHAANILKRLQLDVFSQIGRKPIHTVVRQDMLDILQRIEKRGALDVAKRVNQYCTAIFDYAITKGLCEGNPSQGLGKIIKAQPTRHRAYLKEKELPSFLKELDGYSGSKLVRLAMRLLLLTFVRPGELRGARWDEIDEEKAEWRIPAERMKMKRAHIVPLSLQALETIREIKSISGNSEILFPGSKNYKTPISDVTLTKCLVTMGYKDKATAHGMRSTASTILNENNFRPDLIERQLAHVPDDKVRAAYMIKQYNRLLITFTDSPCGGVL